MNSGTVYQVKIKVENGIINTIHAKILLPLSGDAPQILAFKDEMQENADFQWDASDNVTTTTV